MRPTSSRVREALFSMVGHDLAEHTILDAFGGTGILGLEAWSRGADVTIIERSRQASRAIHANAAALGAEVQVVCSDVLRIAAQLGPFDGVFVDPPYAEDPEPILATLVPCVGGWLALEGPAERQVNPIDGLVLDRRRCYGGTALSVYVGRVG